MKNIGKKIKEIRKQNNLSQENLYPSNQSLVSQIEKGIIKNPNESTLRIFADNIGVSFDELVDGTDWDRNMTKVKKTEYAISQSDPIVTIEKSGEVIVKMKSYPRYNDSGEENKYCPRNGTPLLIGCPECGRSLVSTHLNYCMGCGELLLRGWYSQERVDFNFWCDILVNEAEQKKLHESYYGKNSGYRQDSETINLMYTNNNTSDWMNFCLQPGLHRVYSDEEMDSLTDEEILKGAKSDVPAIRDWWIDHIRTGNYYHELMKELKRYAHLMFDDDEIMETPPLESINEEDQNETKEEDTNNG